MTYPYAVPAHAPLRDADALRAQVNENSARVARAYATQPVTNTGALIMDKAFLFDVTFVERPIFTYGSEYRGDLSTVDFVVMTCSATVYDWVQDDRDFYIGAYVGLRVDSDVVFTGTAVTDFHLEWKGMAYKDVLKDVEARLVG